MTMECTDFLTKYMDIPIKYKIKKPIKFTDFPIKYKQFLTKCIEFHIEHTKFPKKCIDFPKDIQIFPLQIHFPTKFTEFFQKYTNSPKT